MVASIRNFLIGTLKHPRTTDSHAWRDKWCVNCVNMWVASLGQKLNLKNAILGHSIILVHELCHVMSGISQCWIIGSDGKTIYWDETIERILREVLDMKDIVVW